MKTNSFHKLSSAARRGSKLAQDFMSSLRKLSKKS